jgi:predicted O-linked N-acetylglucosamine transferase (SPINDLY family)
VTTTISRSQLIDILKRGIFAHQSGDSFGAEQLYREALSLDPANADALNLLGVLLFQAGKREAGLELLRSAAKAKPMIAGFHMNLGNALLESGMRPDAIVAFERAKLLAPKDANVHFNLARSYRRYGEIVPAVAALREALKCRPDDPDVLRQIADLLAETGELEEARAHLAKLDGTSAEAGAKVRRALMLPPVIPQDLNIDELRFRLFADLAALKAKGISLANPLEEVGATHYHLPYQGRSDRALNEAIAQFYLDACPALAWSAPHVASRASRNRKIRVGFISKFMRHHSIGRTTVGLIEQLSRDEFKAIALFVPPFFPDSISERIRDRSDASYVLPANLAEARELIAGLELDVLFYQDIGMEPFTYFLAFSRLAPVQCTSFGHPDTTGIPNIDYFVSSSLFEPEDAQQDYSERLHLIPDAGTLAFYERPAMGTEVPMSRYEAELPARAHVYVCPQTVLKLHPDFDPVLAGILNKDPDAMVVLIQPDIPRHGQLLMERFRTSLGELSERVIMVPSRRREEFIRLLAACDVMLDTIHFNGMNCTLEALSIGLPVITLPSGLQRGRHTLGMYRRMGWTELVAESADDYVRIAVRLGTDPKARASARREILQRCDVLFSDENVVRGFEAFFKAALSRTSILNPS